eukprot:s218_g35.t1
MWELAVKMKAAGEGSSLWNQWFNLSDQMAKDLKQVEPSYKSEKLEDSNLGVLEHSGDKAAIILQVIERLLQEQEAREKEHNAARRSKLIRDATANNDSALAARLADESVVDTAEIRQMVRNTHNDYWRTMLRLETMHNTEGEMVGLTPAEQKRLTRFAEWKDREQAIRDGDTDGDCSTHDTNARNCSYMLLCILPIIAVREEMEQKAEGSSELTAEQMRGEIVLSRAYQRLSSAGVFLASEGIYTPPVVLTSLRIQRAYVELLGLRSSFSFLSIELPLALKGVADLFEHEEQVAKRVMTANFKEGSEEHWVSGSVLYALLLGKRTWFHRSEGERAPPLSDAPLSPTASA